MAVFLVGLGPGSAKVWPLSASTQVEGRCGGGSEAAGFVDEDFGVSVAAGVVE